MSNVTATPVPSSRSTQKRPRFDDTPRSPSRDGLLSKLEDINKLGENVIPTPLLDFLQIVVTELERCDVNIGQLKSEVSQLESEVSQLKSENNLLRAQLSDNSVNNNSPTVNSVSQSSSSVTVPQHSSDPCEDRERSRAIVIRGIPESQNTNPVARSDDDLYHVKCLINSLGVECSPVCCYRMGRVGSFPRLIKCILPTSKHQRTLIARAPWLRSSAYRGVWIRPSLTEEERRRNREARSTGANRSSGYGNPAGAWGREAASGNVAPTHISINGRGN